MILSGRRRKALLIAHIASAVGWLGGALVYTVLAVAAFVVDDTTMRALYVAMRVIGQAALVPFALMTVVIGMAQALTSRWGLVQHYWVAVKLVLTVAATLVLLTYTGTMTVLSDAALSAGPTGASHRGDGHVAALPSWSPVVHGGAGAALLLGVLVLSVVKPAGLTPYGWRRREQRLRDSRAGDCDGLTLPGTMPGSDVRRSTGD